VRAQMGWFFFFFFWGTIVLKHNFGAQTIAVWHKAEADMYNFPFNFLEELM
jgi:hypothetical protein